MMIIARNFNFRIFLFISNHAYLFVPPAIFVSRPCFAHEQQQPVTFYPAGVDTSLSAVLRIQFNMIARVFFFSYYYCYYFLLFSRLFCAFVRVLC